MWLIALLILPDAWKHLHLSTVKIFLYTRHKQLWLARSVIGEFCLFLLATPYLQRLVLQPAGLQHVQEMTQHPRFFYGAMFRCSDATNLGLCWHHHRLDKENNNTRLVLWSGTGPATWVCSFTHESFTIRHDSSVLNFFVSISFLHCPCFTKHHSPTPFLFHYLPAKEVKSIIGTVWKSREGKHVL